MNIFVVLWKHILFSFMKFIKPLETYSVGWWVYPTLMICDSINPNSIGEGGGRLKKAAL